MNPSYERNAVAVAVEALSWMELEGINERQSFSRTASQLNVTNPRALRMALLLIIETTRRLNLIDHQLLSVIPKSMWDGLNLGQKSFLRSFVYWIKVRKQPEEVLPYLNAARQALEWRQVHPLELYVGKILSQNPKINGLPDEYRIGFETFNQPWFVGYCVRAFGRRLALRYLRSTIEAPPTYVRMNTLASSAAESRLRMEREGIILEPVESLENVFRVIRTEHPIVRTESYLSGFFHIQDKSSCLSSLVSGVGIGENVLDVCAAPGGKTSHIAEMMKNSGTIVSVDYSLRRMEIWRKITTKLGVKSATPIIADGQRPLPLDQEFDTVLLDPPCTSSGAFGRVPSAKWRLTPAAIRQAATMQERLLENAARHVREGGRLIYSTCSVTLEENELLVRNFLAAHSDFHLEPQRPFIGSGGLVGLELCQRLFQHSNDCNGYFIAKLHRAEGD